MKNAIVILVVGVVMAAAAVWLGVQLERQGVFGAGQSSDSETTDPNLSGTDQPFRVGFTTVDEGSLELENEMLGTITRTPNARSVRTLACDVIVKEVGVVPGQQVTADTLILSVAPAPAVLAQHDAAKQALDSAEKLLAEAQIRVKANLGTKAEVLQAQQAVDTSRVQLESIARTLPSEDGGLTAGRRGLLVALPFSPGDLVPAGTNLFSIEAESAAVRFGVPASMSGMIKPGDQLSINGLIGREDMSVKQGQTAVDRIEPVMDPATLTLIGWSKPIELDVWHVGQPVRLTAKTRSEEGLVLPREAVVLSDDGPIIHAVVDGKAVQRSVKIIAGNQDSVCIQCPELSAGDRVAVVGTYELQDGAAVSEALP